MTVKRFLFLHFLLMIYSLSEVFSKLAAGEALLSAGFFLYYGLVLVILFLYALGWQQAIKHISLTSAYANKAVTTIWGTVWGVLLFGEKLSAGKLAGIALIVTGVILFAKASVKDDE